jgi:hypothetical protein
VPGIVDDDIEVTVVGDDPADAGSCEATSSSTLRRSTLCSAAYFATSATADALRPVVSRMLA